MARAALVRLGLTACLYLSACHPDGDWDGSRAALLGVQERVDAQNIAAEKAGEHPPKGSKSWRAYWHQRIISEQGVEDSGNFGHMGRDSIAFIKQQRIEAGLPPAE